MPPFKLRPFNTQLRTQQVPMGTWSRETQLSNQEAPEGILVDSAPESNQHPTPMGIRVGNNRGPRFIRLLSYLLAYATAPTRGRAGHSSDDNRASIDLIDTDLEACFEMSLTIAKALSIQSYIAEQIRRQVLFEQEQKAIALSLVENYSHRQVDHRLLEEAFQINLLHRTG